MRHNYLRRHENLKDVGSWSVGTTGFEIVAQIMGSGPECDQERVIMTEKDAIVLGFGLTDFAVGAAEDIFNASYISGKATIMREDRQPNGERGRTILIFENGVNDTRVEVVMTDYDALEFAKALSNQALDMLIAPRHEAAGI
ncbi:hypothetical protein [Erythrobacter aureus]|uniref:Uncharacterized protein n=1 Tax=Erythrobacter aureus TaxID=2182384 RepID=A0A345YIT2_9SPHN|nr:hypothetical protein [Erythrobacter aureus]AXK43834.1 hypothetical protein DVR09_15375 [Erythrobacter aureus]